MLNSRVIKVFASLVLLGHTLSAQFFAKRDSWKKEQKEIYIGIGAAGFLGDMGGGANIGIHYSYHDLQLPQIKPAWMSAGFRYRISKKWASNTQFSFIQVSGNDALSTNIFRNNRNLNFKSNIFELCTRVEFALSFDKHGNKYKIKKTMFRRYHAYGSYYYLTAGIGAFYYNPKEFYGGNWYNIHDYSLEGQGLPGGPRQFKRVSISIPFGIGAKYIIARRWSVGIEYLFRKTFTDYIDGVSTVYYNPDLLMKYKGPTAVALADPNIGKVPGQTNAGQERGNPKDKDSYFTLEVKIGYILNSKKHRRVTKAKF
ncbi:MAG TPA: DUF6089 family protein [Bacteroidia bacterium]